MQNNDDLIKQITEHEIMQCDLQDRLIHDWFELSYSSHLVLPRLILDSMPLGWQATFVSLLDEIPEILKIDPEYTGEYKVSYRKNCKFAEDPYGHYRHGKKLELK